MLFSNIYLTHVADESARLGSKLESVTAGVGINVTFPPAVGIMHYPVHFRAHQMLEQRDVVVRLEDISVETECYTDTLASGVDRPMFKVLLSGDYQSFFPLPSVVRVRAEHHVAYIGSNGCSL